MRGWKLRSATQIADKVKSLLLGEMAGAEWEILEEREWDEAVEAAKGDAGSGETEGGGAGDVPTSQQQSRLQSNIADEGAGDVGTEDETRVTSAPA